MFYLFGVLVKNEQMLADFGFPQGSQPTLMSLTIIFQYMFGPINKVFSILSTQLTRRFEFQADSFAVGLGKGPLLQSSLIKMVADNLSFPLADNVYSAFTYSHPPILERLAFIRDEIKKQA